MTATAFHQPAIRAVQPRRLPSDYPEIAAAYLQATERTPDAGRQLKAAICDPSHLKLAEAQFSSYAQVRRFRTAMSTIGYDMFVLDSPDEMCGCDLLFSPYRLPDHLGA